MDEYEEESICEGCLYCDSDGNKRPCNICMQWVEGYLEATQYEPKGWND
ncbi:hypothetical protein [Clostridium sp.]|nr:hypothetical protein [Clostridium sp.]